MTLTATRLREVQISLLNECQERGCVDFSERMFAQLAGGGYVQPCSVLPLPPRIQEWRHGHRTARKRADRCALSYRFREIEREHYSDDVFEINTSVSARQGRPMSASYQERPTLTPLPRSCDQHAVYAYGVLDEKLRAYSWVYRVGELVMFSTILGHADYLEDHVMYLLVAGALEHQIARGPGFAFYNRHDSGTDGLRFFKERLGFRPYRIEWNL